MSRAINKKQAAAVTSFGTDVDHHRQELYIAFGHGSTLGPVIKLSRRQMMQLEAQLKLVRRIFEHANAIKRERSQSYVDPNSISTVD